MAFSLDAELGPDFLGIDWRARLSVAFPATLTEPHGRARSLVALELAAYPHPEGRQARNRERLVIFGEAIEHLERLGLRIGRFGFRIGRPEGFELGGV